MASFTDNVPQFNEYVSQQPVEAMVKVGMAKQQKYDTNVQKIQESFSNIAGLQISRDVDKEYLEKQVNDVSQRLKTFASGDFSSNNLTSSMTGMVNGIANDEIIQNSVQSSMNYKYELDRIKKAKEDGTLTPDNLLKFQKDSSSWTNGTEAGESFNASYIEYFDVLKYTREAIDSMNPSGMTYDDIFSGVDKAGNPILSPAMKRIKKEGKMPEDVQAAISQVFSEPRVSQQLQISGEYAYRGLDSNTIKELLTKQNISTLEFLEKEKDELLVKQSLGQDVQANLDNLELSLEGITESYEDNLELADSNPDALRGSIYRKKTLEGYTRLLSNVITSDTYYENPQWRGVFDIQKEANRNLQWEATHRLGWAKENRQAEDANKLYNLKIAELTANTTNTNPAIQGQEGAGAGFDIASYQTYKYNEASTNYINASDELIWDTLFDKENSEELNKLLKKGVSRDVAISTIIERDALKGREPDLSRQEKEDIVRMYKSDKIIGINSTFNDENSKPTENQKILLNNYNKTQKRFEIENKINTQLNENLEKSLSGALQTAQEEGSQEYKIDGVVYNFSPRDILDVASYKHSKGLKDKLGTGERDAKIRLSKAAETRLLQKYPPNVITHFEKQFGGSRPHPAPGGFSTGTHPNGDGAFIKSLLIASAAPTGFSTGTHPNVSNHFIKSLSKVETALLDTDVKETIKDNEDFIKRTYSKFPNLVQNIFTGKADFDAGQVRRLKKFISKYQGVYGDSQNASETFKEFVTEASGSTKFSDLDINSHIITGADGKPVVALVTPANKAMIISKDEAKELGIKIDEMMRPDDVTTTELILNTEYKTSKGDPSKVSTYHSNDNWLSTTDYPTLEGSAFDVQINIAKKGANIFVPYLYISEKVRVDSEEGPTYKKEENLIELKQSAYIGNILDNLKRNISPKYLQDLKKIINNN